MAHNSPTNVVIKEINWGEGDVGIYICIKWGSSPQTPPTSLALSLIFIPTASSEPERGEDEEEDRQKTFLQSPKPFFPTPKSTTHTRRERERETEERHCPSIFSVQGSLVKRRTRSTKPQGVKHNVYVCLSCHRVCVCVALAFRKETNKEKGRFFHKS